MFVSLLYISLMSYDARCTSPFPFTQVRKDVVGRLCDFRQSWLHRIQNFVGDDIGVSAACIFTFFTQAVNFFLSKIPSKVSIQFLRRWKSINTLTGTIFNQSTSFPVDAVKTTCWSSLWATGWGRTGNWSYLECAWMWWSWTWST